MRMGFAGKDTFRVSVSYDITKSDSSAQGSTCIQEDDYSKKIKI